jgi:hypothetical protein
MSDMMPQEQQGQGDAGAVIEVVGQGLAALQDGLMQSNAPDEAKQLITQALESFLRVVEIMGGAPSGQPQAQQQQQQQMAQNEQMI